MGTQDWGGLALGQTWEDDSGPRLRIVGIDPELHFVEAEDQSGTLLVDSFDHFVSTHHVGPRD